MIFMSLHSLDVACLHVNHVDPICTVDETWRRAILQMAMTPKTRRDCWWTNCRTRACGLRPEITSTEKSGQGQTCCRMLRRFETHKGSNIRSNRRSFVLFTSMLASHTVSVCCREISSVNLVWQHVPNLSEFAGRRPTLCHESAQASAPRWLCDIRTGVRVNTSNRHAHRAVGFHKETNLQ